jgi:peptide/nickel transport system permease protein
MRSGMRRWMSENRALTAGLVITGVIVALALLSLVWVPMNPTKMNIAQKLKGPLEAGLSSGLLGKDHFGRDIASMLMVGARYSLTIAAASVAIGAVLGTALGVTAAARPGFAGSLIGRLNDAIFALPPILSAIMLGALMGPGTLTAILAIGTFMIPVFARVTRGAAMQVRARDYILAARMAGEGEVTLTLLHVIPNIASQIIVQVAIQLAMAILTEAGLSFLGLGTPPPSPSWGRMLADSQTYLLKAPHMALAPGLAIAFAVLGFNLLGDGLSRLIDPRRRAQR